MQPEQFLSLNSEVLAQCDVLDGVSDNIIVNVRAFTISLSRSEPDSLAIDLQARPLNRRLFHSHLLFLQLFDLSYRC